MIVGYFPVLYFELLRATAGLVHCAERSGTMQDFSVDNNDRLKKRDIGNQAYSSQDIQLWHLVGNTGMV